MKKEGKMSEKIKTYSDLDIWKKGIEFVKKVYVMTGKFPKEETYGLSSQMRRSAISVPSNVAEGFRRYHNKEYRQFLYIVLGSCAERETQATISKEINYISSEKEKELLEMLDHVSRMITNLIKKL